MGRQTLGLDVQSSTTGAEIAWGPAMAKLAPMQRNFVLALVRQRDDGEDQDFTGAAREAGYSSMSVNSLRVQAYQLIGNERVLAAMEEVTRARLKAGSMAAAEALMNVVKDPQNRSHAKAAMTVLDRGGIGVVQQIEQKVTVDILSDEDARRKLAMLCENLALSLGMDKGLVLQTLLPEMSLPPPEDEVTVTDAVEVPDELADVW